MTHELKLLREEVKEYEAKYLNELRDNVAARRTSGYWHSKYMQEREYCEELLAFIEHLGGDIPEREEYNSQYPDWRTYGSDGDGVERSDGDVGELFDDPANPLSSKDHLGYGDEKPLIQESGREEAEPFNQNSNRKNEKERKREHGQVRDDVATVDDQRAASGSSGPATQEVEGYYDSREDLDKTIWKTIIGGYSPPSRYSKRVRTA
ncbi:hypothetical protein BV25DRAFT_1922308 [Artomyces pyxidatus]|uniref:Uncharacterized protein n=1 Tax=Artomyces pyxidatus TaxID=48021 RepID=A0ACB8SEI2_9AGAM|nr:hypothetical protein BV25DRAFT_1922308 [Artomyces pyxidatus]